MLTEDTKNTKKRVPPMPKTLKTLQGKNSWKRAWTSPTVKEDDYDAILLLTTLMDERQIMLDFFTENPNQRILLINNNTNTVLHPYIKRIETVDKQIESLLNNLGLTPMARSKMGYTTEGAEENPLVSLIKKWNKEV